MQQAHEARTTRVLLQRLLAYTSSCQGYEFLPNPCTVPFLRARDGTVQGLRRNSWRIHASIRWAALARLWMEMVLYIARSENLEAHAEAISHGG
jgi:hypothetical protein